MPKQTVTRTAQTQQPVAKPLVDFATGAVNDLFKQLKLDPAKVSGALKSEGEAILAEFKKLDKSAITDAVMEVALGRLREISGKEQAAAVEVGATPTGDAARLPKPGVQMLQPDKASGTFKLVGAPAAATHAVSSALKRFNVSPDAIGKNVAEVLLYAQEKGKNLASDGDYKAFMQALSAAAFKDAGVVPGKTAEPLNGAQKATETKAVKDKPVNGKPVNGDAGANGDLGLAKDAPKTTGTGATNNAIAMLAKNLSTNKAQDKERSKAVNQLINVLARDAGFDKVSSADRKKLETVLNGVLTDRGSTDGTSRPSQVLANVYAALAENEQKNGGTGNGYAIAADMTRAMNMVVGNDAIPPEMAKGFTEMAALGLTELVGTKLGKPTAEPAADVIGQMSTILGAIGGDKGKEFAAALLAEWKQAGETPAAAKEQSAAQVQDKPKPVSPEAKKAASEAVERLGFDPKSKEAKTVLGAFEQIYALGASDKEVALHAPQWVDQKLGFARGDSQQISQLLQHTENPEILAALRDKGLQDAAMYALDPKRFASLAKEAAAAGAGAPPNGPNGPNTAGGGAPPGGPPFVPPGGPAGGFGTPGVLGPGSPNDINGEKASLYAQRSFVITSILNDPSLSIEDKIFYFMMWFAAFADKEREAKMREIADLDRADQQRKQMKDQIGRERQAMYNTRKALGTACEEAKREVDDIKRTGKAKPEEIQAAESKLSEATRRSAECEGRISELSQQYDSLRNESDQAPKSREILFMELERIDKMRGMMIDMANSFLRESARRIKEIMQ